MSGEKNYRAMWFCSGGQHFKKTADRREGKGFVVANAFEYSSALRTCPCERETETPLKDKCGEIGTGHHVRCLESSEGA